LSLRRRMEARYSFCSEHDKSFHGFRSRVKGHRCCDCCCCCAAVSFGIQQKSDEKKMMVDFFILSVLLLLLIFVVVVIDATAQNGNVSLESQIMTCDKERTHVL
jgi:hypothetical protein